MVRRWSYLGSDKINYSAIKVRLKPILIKKGFKHTVRFKRSYNTLSKIFKKRYSFRKIKNSSFPLLINSFSWASYYLNLTFYEKKKQFKKTLPFSSNIIQSNVKAHIVSNTSFGNVKFINFNSKNKKLANFIKISNNHIFLSSSASYNKLVNLKWSASMVLRSYSLLLILRKIAILKVLLQLFKK